jgi:hypothetical protein
MKILDKNRVKLCCNGQNCPVVEKIGDNKFKITDDFGGEVILSKEELDMVEGANTHFKSQQLKVAENKVYMPGDVLING